MRLPTVAFSAALVLSAAAFGQSHPKAAGNPAIISLVDKSPSKVEAVLGKPKSINRLNRGLLPDGTASPVHEIEYNYRPSKNFGHWIYFSFHHPEGTFKEMAVQFEYNQNKWRQALQEMGVKPTSNTKLLKDGTITSVPGVPKDLNVWWGKYMDSSKYWLVIDDSRRKATQAALTPTEPDQPESSATATPASPPNLLEGLRWQSLTLGSAKGEFKDLGQGVAKYTVLGVGKNDWEAQVYFRPPDFQPQATYELKFEARADDDRTIVIYGGMADGAYEPAGLDRKEIQVGTQFKAYSATFTSTNPRRQRVNVPSFLLGNQTGSVWIRNVTLVDVNAPPAPSPRPAIRPTKSLLFLIGSDVEAVKATMGEPTSKPFVNNNLTILEFEMPGMLKNEWDVNDTGLYAISMSPESNKLNDCLAALGISSQGIVVRDGKVLGIKGMPKGFVAFWMKDLNPPDSLPARSASQGPQMQLMITLQKS